MLVSFRGTVLLRLAANANKDAPPSHRQHNLPWCVNRSRNLWHNSTIHVNTIQQSAANATNTLLCRDDAQRYSAASCGIWLLDRPWMGVTIACMCMKLLGPDHTGAAGDLDVATKERLPGARLCWVLIALVPGQSYVMPRLFVHCHSLRYCPACDVRQQIRGLSCSSRPNPQVPFCQGGRD